MGKIPLVPEETITYALEVLIPKSVLRRFVKQKLKDISYENLEEIINNPEAILTRMGFTDTREFVDLFISIKPRYSVFMFELQEIPFESLNDLHDKLVNMGIEVNRKLTNDVNIKPTLWMIYMSQTLDLAHFFLWMRGAPMEIVDEETRRARTQYSLIKAIATLRPNSKLATVSINSGYSKARDSLIEVLKVLSPGELVKPARNLDFKNLRFVKKTLEYVDKVGYLSLEFTGPELESRYGKITYSGRKTRTGLVADLRKDEEVKEKIVEAFKSGSITRMHGFFDLRGKCVYDSEISFGINFREKKMYSFSHICGRCQELLYKMLYDLWKGVINEFPKEKQKTLHDFFGS